MRMTFARSYNKFLPLAQNCTLVAQCNPCAAALVPLSCLPPLLPHMKVQEKCTSHLPHLQPFCKKMLFPSSLEMMTLRNVLHQRYRVPPY